MNLAKRLEDLEARPYPRVAAPAPVALDTPADVVAVIAEQVNAVRADMLADPAEKARTLGMLASVALRAMEAKDIAARLEAVERVLKLRKDADHEKNRKGTYRMEDQRFRDRTRRSYLVASLVCLNMRAGIAQMRMANNFSKVNHAFAEWPLKAALAGLMFGRTYGHWEAGAVEEMRVVSLDELTAELKQNDYLHEQVRELSGVVDLAMKRVAEATQLAVGEAQAVDLLSQWEGFGRFSREHLAVEPMTLLRAYGLEKDDPGQRCSPATLMPGRTRRRPRRRHGGGRGGG